MYTGLFRALERLKFGMILDLEDLDQTITSFESYEYAIARVFLGSFMAYILGKVMCIFNINFINKRLILI